ncbi:MAG: hypothetical protein ACRBI6_11975 [Acidimicrobiales bacterium]
MLATDERTGAFSAPFAALPEPFRARAIRAALALPDEIGLVSFRELGPTVGQLQARHRLNLLGMEALAAAIHLSSEDRELVVELSASSPKLEASLELECIACRRV